MLQSYKYTKYHAQTNKYNIIINITIIMHMLSTYIKYSAQVNINHILHKTLKYTIIPYIIRRYRHGHVTIHQLQTFWPQNEHTVSTRSTQATVTIELLMFRLRTTTCHCYNCLFDMVMLLLLVLLLLI